MGDVRFERREWWPLGAARTALAAQAVRRRTADRSMVQTRDAGCKGGENERQEGYSSCLRGSPLFNVMLLTCTCGRALRGESGDIEGGGRGISHAQLRQLASQRATRLRTAILAPMRVVACGAV